MTPTASSRLAARLAPLALAAALLAAPAAHASPGCDQCEDLPRLYRELLEQEFLRNKFEEWVRQAYYPGTIERMQKDAKAALDRASAADGFYGAAGAAGGTAGSGGGARPELGTDTKSGKCELMDLSGGEDKAVPTTEAAVRGKYCKPIADFLLEHEKSHQASCRRAKEGGVNMSTVEWFAQDDVAAYQAGIKSLRASIANLARQCSWSGSTNEFKPDQTRVVPTPQQIADLAKNAKGKAGALRRGSR